MTQHNSGKILGKSSSEYSDKLRRMFSNIVPFSQQEWQQASNLFTFHCYQADEYIFSANDSPDKIYFVLAGLGRYFYINESGNEKNKGLVKPGGAFLNIKTLVTGQKSDLYTQALTECHTAAIKYSDLIALSENNVNWGRYIRKLYEITLIKKINREASFLLMSAKERYQLFLQEFADVVDLIPLYHVAMYIGVTDVSLSRIRAEMGLT